VTVALAGAPCPVSVRPPGGRDTGAHMYGPVELPAGAQLRVGVPDRGVRTYLAVRGGIDVPPVFGSRSTDLLGGIGPPPLRPGARLAAGTDTAGFPAVDVAPVAPIPAAITLPVLPGPRADWFVPGALATLTAGSYLVSADSDRVALRLAGPALAHAATRELPTEGMVDGALQVPAGGQPVLLLADHPVTGGYPVLAVVAAGSVGLAAQARPGDRVRFTVLR
jgi:biotin-dependent carboxylase-like uncharacterized protein